MHPGTIPQRRYVIPGNGGMGEGEFAEKGNTFISFAGAAFTICIILCEEAGDVQHW